MVRPLNDSQYLYGLHDPGGEHIMAEQGVQGWILFTEELGSNPNDNRGRDYSHWANQGFGILARLNNGYEPNGTIPYSNRYGDFARRCANFVRNSRGCHIWIIGNEMNYAVERPGVRIDWGQDPPRVIRSGEVILPTMYADCYRQVRAAIKAVAGHSIDQVIVGGVAPWNDQTKYDRNPIGDWAQYLTDILKPLGPNACDGIAIHAYTHGASPVLVYSDALMDTPFRHRQYNFRTYQDFMRAIPTNMRHLPVYLTETDQNDAWQNENSGWIQRAYGEIDWWNRQPENQKIRAVILYRWPRNLDKWGIEGKAGVIEDFKQSMVHEYNWETAPQAEPVIEPPVEPEPEPKPVEPEPKPVEPEPEPAPVEPEPEPATEDTAPIHFGETGYTAEGAFAAFYRRYGLELTGYPITDAYIHPQSGLKTQEWQRVVMEEYPPGQIRLRLAGAELADLVRKVKRLELQIQRLESGLTGPMQPEIADIIAQLPRKADEFIQRPLDAIQYVVINHTAVRPAVGAERVAQAQQSRWPGIVSQYFITGEGQIQQTNPLDEVVSRDQGWIYNGINIYVAGNFDETVPSDAQLDVLAELCAWLLSEFNLDEDAIRGVSEFIVTRSPGSQWLEGQRWKDMLLERVRAVPMGPATPEPGDGANAALQAQIQTLQAKVKELQAKLTDAELRNAALQARLDAIAQGGGSGGAGQPAQPPITDISLQLPRDPNSLKSRDTDQIAYLVFSHTAVDPTVGVERVAEAHQRRWGAILYQFFITAEGNILQTNAPDQVVDIDQPWIVQGINIAVAGDFTVEVPTDAQLLAAAQLSAWLMQRFGIAIEHVQGLSEFITSQSPGKQWLEGKRWRDLLRTRIVEVQESAAGGSAPGDSATIAALNDRITQLEAALRKALIQISNLTQERNQLQEEVATLTEERDRLKDQVGQPQEDVDELHRQIQVLSQQITTVTTEKAALSQQIQTLNGEKTALSQQVQSLNSDKAALNQQLSAVHQQNAQLDQHVRDLEAQIAALQSSGGGGGALAIPAPAIKDVADSLPKHETKTYDTRTLDKITHIAIHHSAAPANLSPERIAAYHVSQGWPGIGYHFYIGPDGTIYQTNHLETISFQVYKQNHYSIGICVAGTFTEFTPTPLQIKQAGHLVAWLMQQLNVKIEHVLGHKQFPDSSTSCPGAFWMEGKRWREMLMARIQEVQVGRIESAAKTLGHYVLFWQRPDSWAQQDWEAANNYFARFRPTAGFSADDAKNAEYVTIVGGVAGVSYEAEQDLLNAGCKVERLAGKDFDDTKRMLDELASSGRRFMTFDV